MPPMDSRQASVLYDPFRPRFNEMLTVKLRYKKPNDDKSRIDSADLG